MKYQVQPCSVYINCPLPLTFLAVLHKILLWLSSCLLTSGRYQHIFDLCYILIFKAILKLSSFESDLFRKTRVYAYFYLIVSGSFFIFLTSFLMGAWVFLCLRSHNHWKFFWEITRNTIFEIRTPTQVHLTLHILIIFGYFLVLFGPWEQN